jgi:hypothetical protein
MPLTLDSLMGEALCGATGYDRLLQEKPRPLTPADLDKAMKLLDEIPKLAKRLVAATRSEKEWEFPEPGDYFAESKRMAATVPRGPDGKEMPDDVAIPLERRLALVEQLPPGPGLAYLAQSQKCIAFLRKSLPRATEQTLTGPKPLMPSRYDLGSYWRKRDVVHDPMAVMRYAVDSLLINEEVATLQLVYPNLYGACVSATFDALADATVEHGEDWLPASRRSIEILLQASPISPDFARQLQEAARAADKANEDPGSAGIPGMPLDVDLTKATTTTQRIADR